MLHTDTIVADMQIQVKPGTYVVAVSGGVDSMVLLHMLMHTSDQSLAASDQSFEKNHTNRNFIVAHYDHGIRGDSRLDRLLVQEAAKNYGLQFVYDEGDLGAGASEAIARAARYAFLHSVKLASGADAIITAHHWDDVLETAIINLIRGTNRRGLTSLRSRPGLLRPLVESMLAKQQLVQYARQNNIEWHEDSTNLDDAYLRNYVRSKVIPKLSTAEKAELSSLVKAAHARNAEIDQIVTDVLADGHGTQTLYRAAFIALPHIVAREIMASWLRVNAGVNLLAPDYERLVVACKTLRHGKRIDVVQGWVIAVRKDTLALLHLAR